MRKGRWLAAAVIGAALVCVPAVAEEIVIWADELQTAVNTLGMSDGQKADLDDAFSDARRGYDEAIGTTRNEMTKILTIEQKSKLNEMVDERMYNYLCGKDVDRKKSINEISDELGISKEQSKAIKDSLNRLGVKLDAVDEGLVRRLKDILRPDQIDKIKAWLK